jgi:hypothetical protein
LQVGSLTLNYTWWVDRYGHDSYNLTADAGVTSEVVGNAYGIASLPPFALSTSWRSAADGIANWTFGSGPVATTLVRAHHNTQHRCSSQHTTPMLITTYNKDALHNI